MENIICVALVCATAVIITEMIVNTLKKPSSSPIQVITEEEARDLQGEADKALDEANKTDGDYASIFEAIKDIMIDLDEE